MVGDASAVSAAQAYLWVASHRRFPERSVKFLSPPSCGPPQPGRCPAGDVGQQVTGTRARIEITRFTTVAEAARARSGQELVQAEMTR